MQTSEIQAQLREAYTGLTGMLVQMNDTDFQHSPPGKWTPGQHLEHLSRSVAPVRMAFGLPLWLIRWRVGMANRPSRTYEELVSRYREKLSLGGQAPERFRPGKVTPAQRTHWVERLTRDIDLLCRRTGNKTESDLDRYILPHPLLGKLTLREMLYFTIYHAHHHRQLIERDLQ